MDKLKTVICDDNIYLSEILKEYINMTDDMECVEIISDSKDCIETLNNSNADILLLDVQMETEYTGIDLIPKLKQTFPELKIIMLSSYDNSRYIFLSLLGGADGYIIKETDVNATLDRIRSIYNNENDEGSQRSETMKRFMDEAQKMYDSWQTRGLIIDDIVKLSIVEYEILREIYNGKPYKKIAEERFVEETTIKSTVTRILRKLGYRSMKELIAVLKELSVFDTK